MSYKRKIDDDADDEYEDLYFARKRGCSIKIPSLELTNYYKDIKIINNKYSDLFGELKPKSCEDLLKISKRFKNYLKKRYQFLKGERTRILIYIRSVIYINL